MDHLIFKDRLKCFKLQTRLDVETKYFIGINRHWFETNCDVSYTIPISINELPKEVMQIHPVELPRKIKDILFAKVKNALNFALA